MFKNRTAWFSSSAKRGASRFWLSEGGAITSWRTADYLFSEDATCLDTKRIFQSGDYAKNMVTVFHSSYLGACEKCHSVRSVSIGHYVLPPASVQDEVRAVVGRFIWEQEDDLTMKKGSNDRLILRNDQMEEDCQGNHTESMKSCHDVSILDTPQEEEALCCEVQHYPVNNMVTGYVNIEELKTYSGELQDFLPGYFGSSVSKATCKRFRITSDSNDTDHRDNRDYNFCICLKRSNIGC